MYIDGVDDNATQTGTLANVGSLANTAVFAVGKISAQDYFDGKIDNVILYRYARTQEQVAWSYNKGKPIAHWKFDECAGTAAYDSSVHGNNGTITPGDTSGTNDSAGTCDSGNGDEMWNNGTTGISNASLDFDSTNDYVSVADDPIFNLSGNFTFSAWVKTTKSSSESIFTKHEATTFDSYYFAINPDAITNGRFSLWDGTDWQNSSGNATVTDGNWHMITVVYDGSGFSFYKDGNFDVTRTTTTNYTDTATALEIGRRSDSGWYFDGQLDDVKVWNYALTAQQIKSEYSGGAVVFK